MPSLVVPAAAWFGRPQGVRAKRGSRLVRFGARVRARLVGAALVSLAGGSGACDDAPASRAGSASAAASAHAAAPGVAWIPLAERNAFQLLLVDDGVDLVWFQATPKPKILAQRLDSEGNALGKARDLAELTAAGLDGVDEIDGLAQAGRLALAWSERRGPTRRVMAWLGELDTPILRPTALGEHTAPAGVRGNLRVVESRGTPTVFFRGENSDCPSGLGGAEERCTSLSFVSLEADATRARRGPLSVPSPCPAAIVGVGLSQDTWQYAVCSWRAGKVVTTLFSVDFSPQYARAIELQPGCAPLGSVVSGPRMLLGFDCGGARKLVEVDGTAQPHPAVDLGGGELRCDNGHAVFEAGSFRYRFEQPQAGLALLLPAPLRHAGVRAVWTGVTLLVAYPLGKHLVLETHECRGSQLTRRMSLP